MTLFYLVNLNKATATSFIFDSAFNMANSYPLHFSAQLRVHLRSLRQKHGLTQAQLGARIGVSQARVAEIEANPGLVSLDQILHVLAALNVSIAMVESAEEASAIDYAAMAKQKRSKPKLRKLPPNDEPLAVRQEIEQDAVAHYFKKLSSAKRGSW